MLMRIWYSDGVEAIQSVEIFSNISKDVGITEQSKNTLYNKQDDGLTGNTEKAVQ